MKIQISNYSPKSRPSGHTGAPFAQSNYLEWEMVPSYLAPLFLSAAMEQQFVASGICNGVTLICPIIFIPRDPHENTNVLH